MTIDAGTGGSPATARADVIAFYQQYLGRPPENEGAIIGRLGIPRWIVEAEISSSQEAQNRRAALAAMQGPQGPQGPAGGAGAGGGGGGGGSFKLPPADLSGVDGIGSAIVRALQGPLDAIGAKLDEITGGKLTEITTALGGVKDALAEAGGRITEDLGTALVELGNGAIALVDSGIRAMNRTVEGFVENAADVFDLAGAFRDTVAAKKDEIGAWLEEHGGTAFGGGFLSMLEQLEVEEPAMVSRFLDEFLRNPALPDFARGPLEAIRRREAPLAALLGIPFIAGMLLAQASAVLAPLNETTGHAAWNALPVRAIGVQDVAAATVRDQLSYDAAQGEARIQGISPERFATLVELARAFPPAQEVIDAWRRDLITQDRAGTYLARLGYPSDVREMLFQAAFIPTPPQDAIRFAVREVYDPVRRDELTLDADLPARFLEEARKAGLSEQLARDYWAAHWELPSVGQVFEMAHRGAKDMHGRTFTLEDVRKYLVAADVAPYWRPLLEQIAYSPLTRVDVRRMRKLDVLSRDEVRDAYLALGYDATNAERLAAFVEADVKGEKKLEKADLTAGLRSRIVTAVAAGTLSEDRGRTLLAELDADPADVEMLIAESQEIREGARAQRIRELVEQLVVKGKWTMDEGLGELRRRGFTDRELAGIRDEITIERQLRGPTEEELADRDLTKAEILDAMSAAIIEETQAREMLTELRYDAGEVDTLISLEQYRERKRVETESIAAIRTRRVAGKITELEAGQQLDRLGLSAERRNLLLEKWDAEQRAKVADLGYATIGELVKRALILEPEAREMLARAGYDDREITLSLALWGSQRAEAAVRAQTAAEKAAAAATARQEAAARREAASAAARTGRQRDLQRAELERAYTRKVIGLEELRAGLARLGYDPVEVDTLVRTLLAKGGTAR